MIKNYLLHKLTVAAFCAIPFLSIAQTPNLGRASSFVLFTSAGAFSNLGTTNITGDIGTHVGALTGFPPGVINGSIHVADSVTALVASHLGVAYGAISARSCDSTIGATLGSGQLLRPKTYCITTLANLAGNLILDAQGDSNAIFVFKINGAFSTNALSTITLINSAALKNIVWHINGAFTLGSNAVFRGTVLSNGAISLLSNASLIGRGLTTAGAISLSSNTSTLPVKFLSFHANCKGAQVEVKWSTVSESNNQHFNLETSTDKLNWKQLVRVNGAGNSSAVKNYSYINTITTSGVNFYRLQQVDFDGTYTYSGVITTTPCNESATVINLSPNPVKGLLHINQLGNNTQNIKSVSVINSLGKISHDENVSTQEIDFSNKPNGVYFVYIEFESETIIRRILVNNNQ